MKKEMTVREKKRRMKSRQKKAQMSQTQKWMRKVKTVIARCLSISRRKSLLKA